MLRALVLLAIFASTAAAARDPADTPTDCRRVAGALGTDCLGDWLGAIERCRAKRDAACETTLRVDDGPLAQQLAVTAGDGQAACTTEGLEPLGFTGATDVGVRLRDACADFGEDLLALAWSPTLADLSSSAFGCQKRVARHLRRLRGQVIAEVGPRCLVVEGRGRACNHTKRDKRIARARTVARAHIARECGNRFTELGLGAGTTRDERLDDVLDRTVTRARHFAQLVHPPRTLGPSSLPGPFPVGIRTVELTDASRLDAKGTGPRPVTIEVYYPSTAEAVAGVPREIASVLGVQVAQTTAYRDVDRAPGPFPLVLFSHGNNGIRIQSFFFAAHLASHGYVVASPDHHGNTFVDTIAGLVDGNAVVNRPLDIRFVLDSVLDLNQAGGNFFSGAIDPERVGVSGHSFGGYTAFAVAAGTFVDPRVRAILPQAPAALFGPAFFGTITIPTLIVGGSIDETTPFATQQQAPFDGLPTGATVVGLAQLHDAGHYTFSDFCEVERTILSFLGGFDEACEPRHLPWRWAHEIVNYLSLNFFDATLRGDAEALGRLDPAAVGAIDDLTYVAK